MKAPHRMRWSVVAAFAAISVSSPIQVAASEASSLETESAEESAEKELYVPVNVSRVPDDNDYDNDESRFITWDIKRIEEVARRYANQHHSVLNDVGDLWYRISPERCPQNYGYNGIRLNVPNAGTEVQLLFKGLAGAEGFSELNTEKAGWRYGFLAYLKDHTRVYGDVYQAAEGTAKFIVPKDTEYLWLVVMGAPTEHWPVAGRRRRGQRQAGAEEQWPYQIKLSGTTLHESSIE